MPPIEGKNWNAEVVDRSFKREKIRNEFYEKLAKLKLGIETNPETVLGNPSASGLKTHEELAGASGFSHETEKGSTLSAILHAYFKENLGVTDAKTRGREVALSLYALTRQKDAEGRAINVDYLNLKWKIEIKAGQLFISGKKGEKIVDGAYLRKPAEGGAAAAAPAGEAGELSEAAGRFVARIRERSKEKKSLDEVLGKVQEGLNVGKQKIDAIIETATPDEIANSTNAWRAWTRQGFLKGPENLALRKSLQKFIFDSEEEIPPAHKKYARQLWRTDMVSHISKKLEGSSRGDTDVVMEKIMGVMRVTDSEDEPAEALKSAMLLDPKIRDREARQKLAKQMEASGTRGSAAEVISALKFLKTGESVAAIKVVVGGDFISIPAYQASNFKFKHAVFVERENRIYAQMENGCMGNLVIIEKVPVPAPPEPPPPEPPPEPPPPGPGPEPPPPGPGPEPPPGPDIPEGGGKTPVPPKPGVPEGGGRTPVPPKPVVPEGGGKTPVPPKPTVPEGSGRTAVPPKPTVPEGGGGTAVPPKPAPAPVPEGGGRTAVPPRPNVPEGSGKTAVPPKPTPAPIPEGSGKTAIPPKPAPAAVPEGGGKTAVPAKPAPAPAPVPEGSGKTAVPVKPAPAPAPTVPEGGGKTAVPPKPAPAAVPEGGGKTAVPPKPAPAPLPPPEGSGKTTIPAKPAPTPPMSIPEGGSKTAIPARPAPIPPPTPEGAGRTAVPTKPAPAPPAPPPEGAGKTQVPPKPAPAPAPEGSGKTAVPPPPEGGGKTAVPPLDEGEPVRPPE